MSRLRSQALLLSLTAAMALVLLLARGTGGQEVAVTLAALTLIALSLRLERRAPHDPAWNVDAGDTAGDVASFALVFVALDGALKWLTPFVLIALLPPLAAPVALPLWAQVIAVTLLIELGAWISHFAHHRLPTLWALHAMHHSPERLYTLNNFRFHPLNHILNHAAMILPPLALGFSPEAVLAYTALTLPVLLFQHSNIAFDFGALNGLLNTNTLHRWHHSADPREGMRNLGRALVIWDRLFGTYLNPADRAAPRRIGLFDESRRYPPARAFAAQLRWPFTRGCCGAAAE